MDDEREIADTLEKYRRLAHSMVGPDDPESDRVMRMLLAREATLALCGEEPEKPN